MISVVVFACLGISTLGCLFVLVARPKLRAARLSAFRRELSDALTSLPACSRSAEQERLSKAIKSIEDADRLADVSEVRARTARLPVPEDAAPGTLPDEQLRELVKLLNDPRMAVALAGGEQLVSSLFEMAVPSAASILGEAALNGFWSGVQDVMATPMQLIGGSVINVLLEEGKFHLKQVAITAAEDLAKAGVHGALDGVCDHLGDAFDPTAVHGAHFPVMTTLLSSMRELRLLRQEKTSIERAVGHVALDTGATAAGGFAGGKAGAAVGTLIAPGVGTVIGMAIGGVVGSMGGRFLATTVKHQPLKKSLDECAQAAKEAEAAVEASSMELIAEARRTAHRAKEDYERAIPSAPRIQRPQYPIPVSNAAVVLRAAIDDHLRFVETSAELRLAQARNSVPTASRMSRWLGLDIWPQAMAELSDARAKLQSIQIVTSSLLPDEVSARRNPLKSCRTLAGIEWPDSGKLNPHFCTATQVMTQARADLVNGLGTWAGRVAQNYQEKVTQVATCLYVETERHRVLISKQRSVLDRKRTEVEKHRAALGR